jgi:hypothetical protein
MSRIDTLTDTDLDAALDDLTRLERMLMCPDDDAEDASWALSYIQPAIAVLRKIEGVRDRAQPGLRDYI